MIQGIVFIIIVAIGFATLILDLIYPLLDPRITYAAQVGHGHRHTGTSPPRRRNPARPAGSARWRGLAAYMRRNPELIVGLCLLLALLVFVVLGHMFVNLDKAKPLSGRPLQPPIAGAARLVPTSRGATCWRSWCSARH